jgi:hypothetical protein
VAEQLGGLRHLFGRLAQVCGSDEVPVGLAISSIRIDTPGLGRYLAELALHHADGRPLTTMPETHATVVARRSSTDA